MVIFEGMIMGNQIWKPDNIKKTIRYLKRNGVRCAYYAVRERIGQEAGTDYHYEEPSAEELSAQRAEMNGSEELFSIVVPAYETREAFLREMIDSVRRQSYPGWELIIVDAGSTDTVERVVEEILSKTGETRIKYSRLAENKGISGNTNAGIALAAGDYIALLDHDDFLAPDALYHMARALRRGSGQGMKPAMLYTDEDKYDDSGRYFTSPHEKQEFNLDLILSNNYICHFMAVEAKLMKSLQLRREYDGAQDYDLALRVVEELWKTTPARELRTRVIHIPQILYHWRCHADSTAQNTDSKSYAYEAGRAAVEAFCIRRGWKAEVRHSLHRGFYEITYAPDTLAVREDVGIVGGRILDGRRRICGGAMDEAGGCLYEGLHREYSGGSAHRASLKQDVAAADVRCMRVREELWDLFRQITGLPYTERIIRCRTAQGKEEMRIADVSGLVCDEAGYRKISLSLARAAAQRGYLILWDPRMTLDARGR